MSDFTDIQARLDELIPMPSNLPIVYLLGDTGAGKTCLVRQFLGTTNQGFPPVRRFRTTVTPTDFIITNGNQLKAAFVLKSENEVSRSVTEILIEIVSTGLQLVEKKGDLADLSNVAANSPDERFRLSCFLDEKARLDICQRVISDLVPRVRSWILANFPREEDHSTAIALALEEDEFCGDLERTRNEIVAVIFAQIREACDLLSTDPVPGSFSFVSNERTAFVERLKKFLSVEEGSISPVVEKARVRGPLKSTILPERLEMVVIDGEGIGHDARESKVLSARHRDYFYSSDAIVLVEDSETPFTRGGRSALVTIVNSGYLSKLCLAFSRLDKVEAEQDGRAFQIPEVERSLRNVLNALRDDGIRIERKDLDVRYFAHMNESKPDEQSCNELLAFAEKVVATRGCAKARFVAPLYDFELLAGFLAQVTTAFRKAWNGYIYGDGAPPAPWQTQKAFTIRMSWKQDEYRFLKPVAEILRPAAISAGPFHRPTGELGRRHNRIIPNGMLATAEAGDFSICAPIHSGRFAH